MKWVFWRTCFLSIVLLGLYWPAVSQADSQSDEHLCRQYDLLLAKEFPPDAPGCAVLVSRMGSVIYEKAFGLADLEMKVPNVVDTVFEIASNTKQFTALAIMQLVEQGKLSLQDSITTFIPGYPTDGYCISIEHLLTHVSGISDFMAFEEFDSTVWRLDYMPIDFIEFFKREHLEFVPGTEYSYSNSGYFLLGYVIEKVSGVSYQKYIEQNIFSPAGMANSCYGDRRRIIDSRAKGYAVGGEGYENAEYVSPTVLYSAGALLSTVEDFFKYYQALNAHVLLRQASLARIRTSYTLQNGAETGYGYGVQVRTVEGHRTVAHAGGGPGHWTMHWYFPDEDVHFIIFTNCENYIGKDGFVFDLALLAVGG